MSAVLLFLLFLSTFSTITALPKHTNITLGSSLSATTNPTSLLSPSGLFAFGFYREGAGFRVGIWLGTSSNKTIVWTAKQDDPPVSSNSTLVLMKNGLYLKTNGAPDEIISGEISSNSLSSASMLDSGNLVLYDSDYKSMWESFNSPTDTILGGQSLLPTHKLLSSTSETDHSIGLFLLYMQSDANLVLYPKDSQTPDDAYWSTGTSNPGNIWRLHLYEDGFMYLVNNMTDYNNNSLVARGAVANNGIVIYRATIDVDGIFRLYSHSFLRNGGSKKTTDWSAPSDKCLVKGFCRFGNIPRYANTNTSPNMRKRVIVMVIVLVMCLVVAFSIYGFPFYKKGAKWYRKIVYRRNTNLFETSALRSFSYSELVKATDDFKEEVGRGGFGTVYKGVLYNSHSHKKVAVKKLEKLVEEGEKEFRTEMVVLGKIHHRNLVRLLGFCDKGSVRLLVYEFMSNGSLANLIFKDQSRLHWNDRVRIALDIARGIFYLHEECEPRIIHCDIKPQNILMDDAWNAKISDFGLAKLLMADQTRTLTGIRGTRGYLAPEWYKNIPISMKTDLYSFGIVLLEVICCRRNIEVEAADDEIILTEWVYKCFEAGDLHKLLGGEQQVESRILDSMLKVGLWCIQDEPALRPSMKNVIWMLEGNMDIPIPPRPT